MNKTANEQRKPLVSIRCVRLSDAPFILQMENDASVWQYGSTPDAPYSIDQIEQFCSAMEHAGAHPDNSGQLRLMIEHDGRPIGAIDLYQYNSTTRSAKVAILIYPAQLRGQRLGSTALPLMITHARSLGIEQLTAEVEPTNEQSRNLFLSCGFVYVGSTEDGVMLFSI